MPNVSIQRAQHKEIGEILGQLGKAAPTGTAAAGKAAEVRSLLNALAGKLTVHLSSEDKVIYPALVASPNAEVSATAKRFQAEMGGIVEVFKKFNTTWNEPAIKANGPQFVTELGGLARAVTERVKKEETVLYPMAEKV